MRHISQFKLCSSIQCCSKLCYWNEHWNICVWCVFLLPPERLNEYFFFSLSHCSVCFLFSVYWFIVVYFFLVVLLLLFLGVCCVISGLWTVGWRLKLKFSLAMLSIIENGFIKNTMGGLIYTEISFWFVRGGLEFP